MIDRDKAIQMAKEVGAGTPESLFGRTDYIVLTEYELQALITRAMQEAYERAAQFIETDRFGIGSMFSQWTTEDVAEEIRSMKDKS